MSDLKKDSLFENYERLSESTEDTLSLDVDILMEKILENINSTPIGQVLKQIASLPEVRQEKVLGIREQITAGQYDVSDRLDLAVDKVLEDLTA